MTEKQPVEVSLVKMAEGSRAIKTSWRKPGLVKIRPCAAEYEDKTYLGIYIGDAALSVASRYIETDKALEVAFSFYNPAIFVPALGKVIYGMESWWGNIQEGDEITDITDDTIENVWYMKALKDMLGKEEQADETQ